MRRTPLYDWHVAQGARMVEFGGWEMPVQYTSVIEEHTATRTAVGLTDVSHMGRLIFSGPDAGTFLDSLLSRDVSALRSAQIRYSLITNEQGGIVDDVLIGLFESAENDSFYTLVVNASNRMKVLAILEERLRRYDGKVSLTDQTEATAMFAIQGPKAVELLAPLVAEEIATMKYYNGRRVMLKAPLPMHEAMLTRTGYTGEDGFELTVEKSMAEKTADCLLERGKPLGLRPTGLGARDTLRLEAGMPLYGHELSETTNPFEAGLGYACCLDGADYPGRDLLRKAAKSPPKRLRVGIQIEGKRPARENCGIEADGRRIGTTTSGSLAPTLAVPVAMGYVDSEFSSPGRLVRLDIRGKIVEGRIVPLPFYKRK